VEYGFARGAATTASHRCGDSTATPVLLVDVIVPAGRKLNEESVRGFLAALRDGVALDPVPVFT
jgi:hypothetical protein